MEAIATDGPPIQICSHRKTPHSNHLTAVDLARLGLPRRGNQLKQRPARHSRAALVQVSTAPEALRSTPCQPRNERGALSVALTILWEPRQLAGGQVAVQTQPGRHRQHSCDVIKRLSFGRRRLSACLMCKARLFAHVYNCTLYAHTHTHTHTPSKLADMAIERCQSSLSRSSGTR